MTKCGQAHSPDGAIALPSSNEAACCGAQRARCHTVETRFIALSMLRAGVCFAQISIAVRKGAPPPRVLRARPRSRFTWVAGYWHPAGDHYKSGERAGPRATIAGTVTGTRIDSTGAALLWLSDAYERIGATVPADSTAE